MTADGPRTVSEAAHTGQSRRELYSRHFSIHIHLFSTHSLCILGIETQASSSGFLALPIFVTRSAYCQFCTSLVLRICLESWFNFGRVLIHIKTVHILDKGGTFHCSSYLVHYPKPGSSDRQGKMVSPMVRYLHHLEKKMLALTPALRFVAT